MVCGTGALGRWGWLDNPFGLVNFGPACAIHDEGYGNPGGRSRLAVDATFLVNMLTACMKSSRWWKPMSLLSWFAFVYHGKVREFGQAAWDEARKNDK